MLLATCMFLLGLFGMEGLAWLTHRYLMHGPLWALHRSHHEPGRKGPELNDLFGLLFGGLALLAFVAGARPGWAPLWWLAAGMSAYGALYALAHDGLAHGRFPLGLKPRRGYLLRLVQAHQLHHRVRGRDGAVSFGFLLPAPPEALAAKLRARRSEP